MVFIVVFMRQLNVLLCCVLSEIEAWKAVSATVYTLLCPYNMWKPVAITIFNWKINWSILKCFCLFFLQIITLIVIPNDITPIYTCKFFRVSRELWKWPILWKDWFFKADIKIHRLISNQKKKTIYISVHFLYTSTSSLSSHRIMCV